VSHLPNSTSPLLGEEPKLKSWQAGAPDDELVLVIDPELLLVVVEPELLVVFIPELLVLVMAPELLLETPLDPEELLSGSPEPQASTKRPEAARTGRRRKEDCIVKAPLC
jgi:hypothetical protein